MTAALLDGAMLVGETRLRGSAGGFRATDPATGALLDPLFGFATVEDTDRTVRLAADAFPEYAATSPARRAKFLERIADRLSAVAEPLIERARRETALSKTRLRGELHRTTRQLHLFADLLRSGGFPEVRIDERDGAPALRQTWVPLGPVAVFGASNFPLAFSGAGGDVVSALAAGCTVIFKVHNAHPGTGLLAAAAVVESAVDCGLPDGVYSALVGDGNAIGHDLVAHPEVRAAGFTGSRAGGLALVSVAAARAEPIPVFAEMSSINPVIVFGSRADESTAAGFVSSLTLDGGQFCTNPGLVFVPDDDAGDRFVRFAADRLGEAATATMLTASMADAFSRATERIATKSGVIVAAQGARDTRPAPSGSASPARALIASVDAATFRADPSLQDEVFGPFALIVRYRDLDEVVASIRGLDGQLTASLHGDPDAEPGMARVLRAVERRVGRIIVNGWPTGVAVSPAMVHGGPFPATSDGRSTSVGTLAAQRWVRPITYQSVPDSLLPPHLTQAPSLAATDAAAPQGASR